MLGLVSHRILNGVVVHLSLATQCLDECVTRVSYSEGLVIAVELLPVAAARIALILSLYVDTAGKTTQM